MKIPALSQGNRKFDPFTDITRLCGLESPQLLPLTLEIHGGMQQRVNLARVLVNRPEVLLMDGPFGALDAQTRLQMQELLLNLWGEYGMTVVFVTHDIDEAILLSDRVLIMSKRPSRIQAEIPVPLVRPRSAEKVRTLTPTTWLSALKSKMAAGHTSLDPTILELSKRRYAFLVLK